MKRILALFIFSIVPAQSAPDGKLLFTTNCSACHLLDEMLVGPSLVEIRNLYQGKPDDFVKWSIAPHKKRANTIDMPSMIHVGEEGLKAIYAHIMEVSKNVTEKKKSTADPYTAAPTYPKLQRIFLPNASPAAIAIALRADTSLCWDAGTSRLRYSWTGGFIDGYPYWKGNGDGLATIQGTIRYTEEDSPFGKNLAVQFGGYKLKDGFPSFRYQVGTHFVTEAYTPHPKGAGFVRSFTISPTPQAPLVLHFPEKEGVSITSDKGKLEAGKLTLTPKEAASFQLLFSFL